MIKQKEIVLLPYPFTNFENTKVRPALIISNDNFNEKQKDCILIPLTTVLKNNSYSINLKDGDLREGYLIKTSQIKIDKVFTVEKDLIIMKIASINNKKFDEICKKFLNLFF